MTVEAARVRAPATSTVPGRGNWWVQPVAVAIGFSLFVIYSGWSVLNIGAGSHAWKVGPYLSPYYSPEIAGKWWPFSPAVLVAIFPLGFRATCYYYRKAYYRAFFWDPPACAIREPGWRESHPQRYKGETSFPWILNNLHRFFLYLALIILAVLWYDAIRAFSYHNALYIGAGTVIMVVNVILLTGYTFSCHALRHLVGGGIDCYSCIRFGKARHGLWRAVTQINPFHGFWAWASLISVGVTDIYIRLVSAGVFGSGCFGAHTGC